MKMKLAILGSKQSLLKEFDSHRYLNILCKKIPDEALRRKEIIFLDRSIYTNRVWVKQ